MKKQCVSDNWLLSAPGTNGFVPVDLPNDYAISQPRSASAPGGGSNGYFNGGFGRYVRYLPIPADARHVILNVDGAYMISKVKCNDNMLFTHPHGYTPYLVDLTEKILPGHTNKLEINTNDLQPSTRWYSGAGVYRDVFLWFGGDVRVEPWDIFVTTPEISGTAAKIVVHYDIASDIDTEAELTASVPGIGEQTVRFSAKKGEKTAVTVELTAGNPHLWSLDDPYLYTLNTEIKVGEDVTDTAETAFGIRSIAVDAKNGFRLNGVPMKLRGGCIHHDHGVLGAAAYPAAEYRKVSRLKAAGFNALRIAHNPPSLALLEVCDRVGMLVMDEAFDMWQTPKNRNDYNLWFADWHERDIASMVLRERNHPSVICYSIGNEIPESAGISDSAEWSALLASEIRKYDDTRFTTTCTWGLSLHTEGIDPDDYRADYTDQHIQSDEASCKNSWQERTAPFYAPHTIAGYNYMYNGYAPDHEVFPDRVMWGSESHAINFCRGWRKILAEPWAIGDFTWTAYDNLGEVGTGRSCWARDGKITGISIAEYPWRSCYQGDLDLCGYRRPQSYFREAVWLGGTEPRIFTTHPEHYGEDFSGTGWHWYDVLDTWTFDDAYLGKPVLCEVYTDADEIEWFVNGKNLGRSRPDFGIAHMDIPYEKGEIRVIAYKNGASVGESSLHTVGAPAAVTVKPERAEIAADGRDLCYFDITVVDENGERVPNAGIELSCSVEGGIFMGIFSGDPKNEDQYTSPVCHAFEGRALVIVRAKTPGDVRVTVTGDGLAAGSDTCRAE